MRHQNVDKSPVHPQLNQLWVRIILIVFLVIVACSLLAILLTRVDSTELATIFGHDYRAYSSAARVLIIQGNPYDRAQLLAMEQANGFTERAPIMVWNPPWALALFLPFAFLPFPVSTMIWLFLSALLALICGAVLWRELAPHDDRRYWLGMILAVAYMPTVQTLIIGQISLWLLVGITGFLVAMRARRDVLAGVFLILLTIKPHVSFLFLLAVAWWIVRERRWCVLLGGVAALAAACTVVGLISPAVFGQYLRPTAGSPLYWRSTTLGTWLLMVFGAEHYWLQYLPSVLGFILLVGWALLRKGVWDLPRLSPGLLLASTIFASYGWGFDQVTLLPVVVVLLARLYCMSHSQRIILLSVYISSQLGMLALNQLRIDMSYYYWYPLVLAGLYIWQLWVARRKKVDNVVY